MGGRLEGKIVFISGACSGIGLATTELFIAEGARVLAADIQDEAGAALERRFEGRLRYAHCDVTQPAQIQAAVDHAASLSGGKVGVVGYCWGGLLTWRAACLVKGVAAAVSYYGGGVTTAAEMARQAHCPVQAHFGAKDHWIALETVEAFRQAQPQVEVHVYEADHGFNCNHRGSFDAAAADQARARALAFFAAHVG